MVIHETVIHEIVNGEWGSNLGDQVFVADAYVKSEVINRTDKGLFGRLKKMTERTAFCNRPATDEDQVIRCFYHLCGVHGCFLSENKDKRQVVVVMLDGHNASIVDIENVEFRTDYTRVNQYRDAPIAELWFHGTGKRRGPLYNCQTNRLILTFSDDEQMFKYLHSVPNQAGK